MMLKKATMVSGVSLAGLMTEGQPAARAAESFLAIMPMGKFQGTIRPVTPMGR